MGAGEAEGWGRVMLREWSVATGVIAGMRERESDRGRHHWFLSANQQCRARIADEACRPQ